MALNDTIMVFAFAPIVALLLGLSAITVPWATLVTSVVLYIVIPVLHGAGRARCAAAGARQRGLRRRAGPGGPVVDRGAAGSRWCCCSPSRAEAILAQPLVIAMLAVPILLQVLS